MCLTAPVLVTEVAGATATVEVAGALRPASTILVPEVRPGDWALLTAGALVRILDPRVAAELTAAARLASEAGDDR